MQINLFICTAEKNRVDKSGFISNRFAIDGVIKNKTSVIDIVVTIQKNNPTYYNYNYMYVELFKRWYFITDIININGNMWEIHATCDVLYSFAYDIKNSYAIIDKSENEEISNLYFDDGSFIMDTRKDIELKPFSSGFNETGSYILICAGGV